MGILDGFTQAQASGKDSVKKVGIGGYSMFARVNDSTEYPAQVPVDVLEDGSNASDDIINGPITIKISGVVADVYVDAKPNSSFSLMPDYSKYGEVIEYIPSKTQQQLQRMNEIADRAEQKILEAKRLADKGAELFGLVGNPVSGGAKSIREQFLDFIEAVYFGKQLISVEVDYRTHENMALSGLVISTDNQTSETKFEASFTKVNFSLITTAPIEQHFKSPSAAAKSKTAAVANKGAQTPADNSKQSNQSKSVAYSFKDTLYGKS
ncbi:phage baseplate protein [Kluyvera cryocrescens]|uniref:phage baseplate protein n=1 Tax=Kluyvera cryocrescens TaxID=580 RepID=UPI000773B5EB|nr:hypothetical protein [Kluyvera cryocrescens]HDG1686923.1 hypothetical protein [Kluyvera cryocrescens]